MSRQPNRRRSRRVVLACAVLMLVTAERGPYAIVLTPLGMPRVLTRVLLFVSGTFDVAAQNTLR
jgi:hypothetical protein